MNQKADGQGCEPLKCFVGCVVAKSQEKAEQS